MTRRNTLVLASCLCLSAACGMAQTLASNSPLLIAAANSYRANLEAFEDLTCRYTVTWGFAKSLDDALAGRLEPNAATATAVFYKSGKTIRFRIEEDAASKAALDKPPRPEKMAEAPGLRGGPLVPFMTRDYLLNGTHALLHDPRGHYANLYDGGTEKGKEVDSRFLLTPLLVNTKYDFGLLADQVVRSEIRSSTDTSAGSGVRTTFHFTKDPVVTFTIDLTRGSLPVRVEMMYENGAAGASYTVVPQIRACSNGRWFPERVVTFLKQTPTQSPCLVNDFRVVELDVDRRPSKGDLAIHLPAGTIVNQSDDPRKFFKTRRPERVGPDDLARIQQLTEEVPKNPRTDTTIVLPRRYAWVWYVVPGVVGLLVLAYLGRRRMAARRQSHAPS